MRKFFILTLMVACLMMVSCVERRNRVILEKFVPVTTEDSCAIKFDGDKYYTEGKIDLAFTRDYQLGFQVKNYIPSSDGGNTDLATAEANYFYAKEAEVEYDWNPQPQVDGRQLKLDQKLWNKKQRKTLHGVVTGPDGSGVAGIIHIFEEAQIVNLLENNDVNNYDWIASPLVVKVRIIGELADGTYIKTNQLKFNIMPSFGGSLQQGVVYLMPDGGFPAPTEGNKLSQEEYDKIMEQCSFQDPVVGGCYVGQDTASVNCFAGDSNWEKYIVESNGGTYTPGYAAAGVVEVIYNSLKKSADETGYYVCCPLTAPDAPEEKEEDANGANSSEGNE